MGNRFVFVLGLIFLVGSSYSAPTLNPTTSKYANLTVCNLECPT